MNALTLQVMPQNGQKTCMHTSCSVSLEPHASHCTLQALYAHGFKALSPISVVALGMYARQLMVLKIVGRTNLQ